MIMKFEFLPNEILIEIFKYLNLFDKFHSFHYLNERFNQLLRSISLYFDFQSISKSKFDQFCQLLKSNPEIKNQIYSLKLSNKDTFGQIELFLSKFSLKKFPQLHSLTLIQLKTNNITQFPSKLNSCHLIDSDNRFQLQINKMNLFSLTNLTISRCSMTQLVFELFRSIPLLKHLKVENLSRNQHWTENFPFSAIHLEQLIILNFEYIFHDFKDLVKYTPNLISLELCGCFDDLNMIDANKWEYLITTSLNHLEIFKFVFNFVGNEKIDLLRFQNDFWLIQHQWYTDYLFCKDSLLIYTTPYMLDYYELSLLDSNRYSSIQIFDNVTNLTLYTELIKEGLCQYYFPNVTSLTILPLQQSTDYNLSISTFHSLKTFVNLLNLIHFGISPKFRENRATFLPELFQESPRLISLKITARYFDDLPLCSFGKNIIDQLTRIIKKIDIYEIGYPSFRYHNHLVDFCEIFVNLEQLTCIVGERNDILFLLQHLPKLSSLRAYILYLKNQKSFQYWFEKETSKINLSYQIKLTQRYETELLVWIDRKTNLSYSFDCI